MEEEAESADLAPAACKETQAPPPPGTRKLDDVVAENDFLREVVSEQPIRMEGTLEIKLKPGGNKGLEHWEEVFAVLQGETLSLFRDREAAKEKASRWPPVSVSGAVCRENASYRRKENTFKLILQDGSQFLFSASSRALQQLWVKKLQNSSEPTSSDSDDSGRASSVNVSLEKLAEAPDDLASPGRAESLERQSSAEGGPPPKPPHTYYNKHRYPDASGVPTATGTETPPPSEPAPPPPDAQDPPTATPQLPEDGSSKSRSVFRKFFIKK
ncbi:methyl-CpG-binding protein 2-like [Pseudoliparis swirei]|uniref:methyl-CpG-binding protein 2-like n=1 Tax=Pseudoliparis swirei TaxID=2059687 RepID=UPI0024BE30C7|nr:methyl-CpG-binding protein 2-like [Pseudoliparis swirei]